MKAKRTNVKISLAICAAAMIIPVASHACGTEVQTSDTQPYVLAEQEGSGTDAVAVRIEYTVNPDSQPPSSGNATAPMKAPVNVFIDVSGTRKAGDWKKIGLLLPFGPNATDSLKKTTVAIPADLKAELGIEGNEFPVALSAGDSPLDGTESGGLSLKAATVIRD